MWNLLIPTVATLLDKIIPDPQAAAAAKMEMFRLQQTGELAQITGQLEINKSEAQSSSVFVSGWRPFIGWVCGAAFAWNWIGLPMAKVALGLAGYVMELAPADLSEMMPVLLGMLGLSVMRTVEKIKDVARS
jgi:hypothetical protein